MAVPVKKIRKPSPSVKYLLSGDRKLQRLSLRKIRDRVKKAKPKARSQRVKPVAPETAAPSPWAMNGRFMVVGVVCLLAAAALLTAGQPGAPPDGMSAGTSQPAHPSPQPARLTAEPTTSTPTTIAPTRSTTEATGRPHTAPASKERTSAAVPVKTTQRPKPPASVAAAPQSTARVKDPATRTVEGCLEFEKSMYRLKNTSGLNAPTARSWRSGFLMKRSSSIELVDTSGRLKLQDHVGQRVAATGSLVNLEMQVTTLREIAGSCR
jgi:hypothetical protein